MTEVWAERVREGVTRQFEGGIGAGWRQFAVDGVIAVVVFGVSALRLTGAGVPGWAFAVLAGMTLPLVLRRWNPLLANILIAPSAVIFGFGGWPSPLVPVGPLVALHAIAAYGRRAQSLAFLALALFAAPGVLMLRDSDYEPYEWLHLALAAVVAWMAGALTAARRREAAQFEERMAAERALRRAEAERAAAEERNRIGRDMHDSLGHSVAVMVVLAEGAAAGAEAGRNDPATLDVIAATGRRAMAELRAFLGPLRAPRPASERPPAADHTVSRGLGSVAFGEGGREPGGGAGVVAPDQGGREPGGEGSVRASPGVEDVGELVETMRRAGAVIELRSELRGPVGGVAGVTAYRIVQEALTNAMKHAYGVPVTVVLAEPGPRITVSNPLTGPVNLTEGHGLRNMRERAGAAGGWVEAGPAGEVWRVVLQLGDGDAVEGGGRG